MKSENPKKKNIRRIRTKESDEHVEKLPTKFKNTAPERKKKRKRMNENMKNSKNVRKLVLKRTCRYNSHT